ncbi:MAG: fibrobacter succinogenes major paralogous domain-containing protein [Bacteroidetes bacterium]|nr:fibrobacter succinogenes major paralogous domain-containing protein [Bacteroidota bacterium]MCL2328158.1 fibrobacter succinogenes major paralogous domain-containing protein [Bacteroidota bacterium]
MEKTTFLKISLLAVLGLASVVFNACKDDESKPTDQKITDVGVVINGVTWATRNVDAFGTFTEKPESVGMRYQWNHTKAWNDTDTTKVNWDDNPNGTTWEKANDPSPAGWRVPTKEEQESLFDTEKVTNEKTTQNGVAGWKFTDKSKGTSLFFPVIFRNNSNVILYWSSTPKSKEDNSAYCLMFYRNDDKAANVGMHYKFLPQQIRSVLAK